MKFQICDMVDCERLYKKADSKYVKKVGNGFVFDLPSRSTSGSAGYDFHSPFEVKIKKGKTVSFPLLVKAIDMPKDMALLVFNRSGLSLKYGLQLDNAVGVIDSDYKQCIWVQITNNGKHTYYIHANDKVAQGIFVNYGTVDNDKANGERNGGFGSTGK